MSSNLKKKPDLSFATLWNLSFGFFGANRFSSIVTIGNIYI